jgi:hypothetical protein
MTMVPFDNDQVSGGNPTSMSILGSTSAVLEHHFREQRGESLIKQVIEHSGRKVDVFDHQARRPKLEDENRRLRKFVPAMCVDSN